MATISLRVRSKEGTHLLKDVPISLTFAELQDIIQEKTHINKATQKILAGYPPQHASHPGTTSIGEIFKNGDVITVEENATQSSTSTSQVSPIPSAPLSTTTTIDPVVQHSNVDAEGTMVRRKMADDNSCLFNAVGYVLEGRSRSHSSQLRQLIAKLVQADPITYDVAFLGKTNADYAQWIQESNHWGGAIELALIAQHYRTEISAFDIITKKMYCYGEGSGYSSRVYLIYDGIHYDSLAYNPMASGPEDFDITVFNPQDTAAQGKAAALVNDLHAKGQFTDMAKFQLLCTDCNTALKGEKEAAQHAMATGHGNFVEKR
eukprot:TRINITY_DN12804_c0_g1_i1.p1 TRINITY_DN12804_c0_g1~~TRINITY_DN12804_c0_g1_i1.p1  ORF type:complete len:319 (-),score=43.83 TRINITY_DN12804_c0_g1_i1:40-996(-)